MRPRDSVAFSQAAEELIAQLHDIVHEQGWDAPARIAWLLSDEGEDAPPHAALEELANSELFTVTTTPVGSDQQVALKFSYAGRLHYCAVDLQHTRREADDEQPLSAATVAMLAERMVDLPWPDDDEPPKRVEWRLDGYEGQTNWGILHLVVLGDDADPATLRQETPPAVSALDARWGSHHELQVSTVPAFDRTADSPDPRSILAALATAMEATKILWWRPDDTHRVLMTIREEPQDHLTALLVTMPQMLDGPEHTAPSISSEDVAGMDLKDIAALAMHFPWSEEERVAFRSPPYPLPTGLVPAVEALEAALPAGHEHARGGRVMYRAGLPAVVLRLLRDGVLDRRHDAEFLITTAAESDLPAKDRDLVVRDLLVHLVEVHLGADDVTAAERTAARIGDVTPRSGHLGWRSIAAYHAANGDASSFLRLWSRCDARQDRVEMRRLKEQLIRSLAVREGWRAAVEVCDDKRIGDAFRRHAFEPPASGYYDLHALFSGEAAGVLDEVGELHALVAAVASESPRPPTENHRGVEDLLTRISALDPDVSRAAMRERDHLLFDLRGAVGDEGTLARLRAELRTPRLVREAMRLVDDAPAES